jgi:broad specificity phosphatase PhoE
VKNGLCGRWYHEGEPEARREERVFSHHLHLCRREASRMDMETGDGVRYNFGDCIMVFREEGMQIFVVRHGETQWNKEEIFRGRNDVPLNEIGRKQADRVGARFAGRSIDLIVSSPLARALQTAEAIGRTTGKTVRPMEDLTDMSFGAWEGLSLKEVENRHPGDLAIWRESPQKLHVEGGETLMQVRQRLSQTLATVSSDASRQTIVVVTHRVICKLIVLHCLGIGNDHFWDMRFDPCSVTLMEYTGDRAGLVFSNDTCHLEDGQAYRDF